MTKYLQMNTKSLITNPYLLVWSIAFIEFWVIMFAYVFGNRIPSTEEAVRIYTATAFGSLLMLSLSSSVVTITQSLLYSSKSIRFITKYTKLSPSRFLLENLASSLVVLLIISAVMFVSVTGVFYARFGMLMLPVDWVGLIFSIVISTLFIYSFSLFLNFVIVHLRAPRAASFITFLPLMLGFTAYASIWIDFGSFTYVSPFNCIISICYYFFSGKAPPTGNLLMQSGQSLVNIPGAMGSLIVWSVTLLLLGVVLLRKMRGLNIEEIRTN